MDILFIGTMVVDIRALPIKDSNEWEEKQRIEQIAMSIGGDAANQAIRAAAVGKKVALCAAAGLDNNAIFLCNYLERFGVDISYVSFKKEYSTGTALVLLNDKGERNVFSVKGAHSFLSRDDLPNFEKAGDNIPKAISIGSLFSIPELEKNGLKEYLHEAKNRGILIFSDVGSDKEKKRIKGIEEFLPYIDYFLPSDYESKLLTGADTVQEAAKLLLDKGCRNVVIKCGAKGCYYRTAGGDEHWIKAIRVNPKDTTGAGDCMVGLFASRILDGASIYSACKYATAGASLSTLYTGASEHRIEHKNIMDFMLDNDDDE